LIPDLELALELADIVETITLESFRTRDLVVEAKPDLSLVSAADRGAEEVLRAHLDRVRPDDAVWGEEFGEKPGTSGARWVLDPIDGTHNYVRGVPVWASLIALEREGEVVAGVVAAPAINHRWWASRGEGAYTGNGARLQVSEVSQLDHAFVCSGWDEFVDRPEWLALAKRAWRSRGFGDFWSLMLVAEGAVDAAVEPGYHWDLAAPLVIVEEAGGRFTSLDGGPALDAGHAVATNGRLHDEVLAALR
jgi:histidinol-phosphatase